MRQQVGCHEGAVGVATHSYLACVCNPPPLQLLTTKAIDVSNACYHIKPGSVQCDTAAGKDTAWTLHAMLKEAM